MITQKYFIIQHINRHLGGNSSIINFDKVATLNSVMNTIEESGVSGDDLETLSELISSISRTKDDNSFHKAVQTLKDYIDSMDSSDHILCNSGGGNFTGDNRLELAESIFDDYAPLWVEKSFYQDFKSAEKRYHDLQDKVGELMKED